jgi:hypothetical protein
MTKAREKPTLSRIVAIIGSCEAAWLLAKPFWLFASRPARVWLQKLDAR